MILGTLSRWNVVKKVFLTRFIYSSVEFVQQSLGACSHRTRKHICANLPANPFDVASKLCEQSHDHNVFHNLLCGVARCSASCVNWALLVIVEHCVEPMGHCDDGAVRELSPDGVLDQGICLHVHSCSCFIQNQDLGVSQQGSGKAKQLSLTNTGKQIQRYADDGNFCICTGNRRIC